MIRGVVWVVLLALLISAGVYEVRSSFLQSRFFSRLAADMTWQLEAGPSDSLIFPADGPYNRRHGYTSLASFSRNLQRQGFEIVQQASFSASLQDFVLWGGNPPYHEKRQSGLAILNEAGSTLYLSRQPRNTWHQYTDIPPVLVDSLLFIENRGLVDNEFPLLNPAVEWARLGQVTAAHTASLFDDSQDTAGASTLATQLEKFRYSPAGLTTDVEEKLHQMVSAAMRAYRDGPDTTAARQRIVRDYLNSTPLSGRAGFGEILGLGEGLWAWYGIDFDSANQLLKQQHPETDAVRQARVYKAALSLLLSQRRPSHYLLRARDDLAALTDSYLRVLGAGGVIDRGLMLEALDQPLLFREGLPVRDDPAFISHKAVNSVRTELLSLLDVGSLYDLDRLDLSVTATVASDVQQAVEEVLHAVVDPVQAREMGLTGYRLLDENQLDAVRFSVVLYETTPDGNKLRVQTDNLDTPFDLNEDSKLDLGSTAKLRTLITYLDIVETLYHRFHVRPAEMQQKAELAINDPLRQWVVGQLRANPRISLQNLLDAAMVREYSASPGELFFTAGGQHRFSNFDSADNSRVMTLAEAFNRSVNLVFIRVMRDISRFYINEIPGIQPVLEGGDDPLRHEYLTRFADHEGSEFLLQFYKIYRGLRGAGLIDKLAQRVPPTPYRMAMALRSVQPDADAAALGNFLAQRLDKTLPEAGELQELHAKYARENFNSNDRAYLADVHPLELWLVEYLLANPEADWNELAAASAAARQDAYAWLFKTQSGDRQQSRIRILVEQDAFTAIHRQWQRLGYPFGSLVPSYATALGVSADRPTALTELMGIIVNDGYRLPMTRIDTLHFGAGTPYETLLQARKSRGEQVLSTAISRTVRNALMGIVESGTGKRLSGVFTDAEGRPLPVGGKTGTGDHRSRRFGAGGQLIEETVVNRNAIFTFFIDDRLFGTILASVGGPEAKDFEFTSSLAAQLLKVLEPALRPLLRPETELLTGMAVEAVARQ